MNKSMKIITLSDVTFKYPKAAKSILDKLSFAIMPGEFVFLVGSNGCGKSTLFKIIMSQLKPTHGKIIKAKNLRIAYISQNIYQSLFMDLTVAENLTLMHIPLNPQEEIVKHLASYHPKLPSYFNQPVKLLSGGEKQALALAIKLFHTPDLLLLDEHTSALDPEAEKSLMELTNQKIQEQKITTLICTHKINHISNYGSRIIGLNKGKIVFDEQNSKGLTEKCINIIYQ